MFLLKQFHFFFRKSVSQTFFRAHPRFNVWTRFCCRPPLVCGARYLRSKSNSLGLGASFFQELFFLVRTTDVHLRIRSHEFFPGCRKCFLRCAADIHLFLTFNKRRVTFSGEKRSAIQLTQNQCHKRHRHQTHCL